MFLILFNVLRKVKIFFFMYVKNCFLLFVLSYHFVNFFQEDMDEEEEGEGGDEDYDSDEAVEEAPRDEL